MTLVQIKNYTSPNCTDRPRVNIHCIGNFFTVHEFWATCACPGKAELLLKFFTVLNILFTFRILNNLRLPWKTELLLKIFTVLNIFFTIQEFWATCMRFPWKTEDALKYFTVLNKLFTFRIFEQLCACPEKQSFPWNFSLYWIYFAPFRIFEQLCACPEKQSCFGIFHCIEYTFYIQEFWATCMRLPWKTQGALNSQYWLYIFYHSGFLSNFVLALKNRVALEFFTVLKYFLSFRIFEQLALAQKNRGCPEFTVLIIYFLSFRSFE